ncbi:hypothetical protein K469DRAFT_754016 [Zopfia rhizophila CBS 207.26]|uniref:Wax synthase domain-containing protein n=1 Tax=Zopfia rhizophila CBS 207.26 TaxID=1314779 RepID=A0A6A6DNM7_9PEZI|nr:hypothetical protein K469DRAFT_754016 [Zopfia rhizophila CBS 207.26]
MPSTAAVLHISLLVLQVFFYISPPFPGRRFLCVTTITLLAIAPHFVGPVSDKPGDAQPYGLLWPIYLSTLDKFLFTNANGPEESYWRADRPAREAMAMRSFGPRKIKWAAAMMFNTRGVRWNWEVKNLPPKPRASKRYFLLSQTFVFFKMLFMSDVLLQLSERLFWTPRDGQPRFLDSKYLTVTHPDWRWSFFKVLVFACGPYFFVNMQYAAAAVIAVLLNLSKPEDWPPYFGDVKEVTTVRHFWGSFWHQTLRRSLTKATGFVVDVLRIPRGSNLSSYTQIWLAFAISGLMHTQFFVLLPYPSNINFSERTMGVMAFFMWQAAAITLEDFVQWVWCKSGGSVEKSNWFKTVIGYSWVLGSFWISLPWVADVMMRIRLTEESFLGFSVVREWVQMIPLPPKHD